jgi:hypothetical protein
LLFFGRSNRSSPAPRVDRRLAHQPPAIAFRSPLPSQIAGRPTPAVWPSSAQLCSPRAHPPAAAKRPTQLHSRSQHASHATKLASPNRAARSPRTPTASAHLAASIARARSKHQAGRNLRPHPLLHSAGSSSNSARFHQVQARAPPSSIRILLAPTCACSLAKPLEHHLPPPPLRHAHASIRPRAPSQPPPFRSPCSARPRAGRHQTPGHLPPAYTLRPAQLALAPPPARG